MTGFAKALAVGLLGSVPALATGQAVMESTFAKQDVPLELNPASAFWSDARPIYMEKDSFGKTLPRYRTEVRSRWTKENLYFLFVCPYEQLHLKPVPNTRQETNELWNWDVAEVFVGSDFSDIKRYKESTQSSSRGGLDVELRIRSGRQNR